MARIVKRRIANERRHQIQPIKTEYSFRSLVEISSASFLYNVVASRPIPVVVINTRGVKTPCSLLKHVKYKVRVKIISV